MLDKLMQHGIGVSGGSGIKRIQHVEVLFAAESTINKSVSAVDINKCVVYVTEVSSFDGNSSSTRLDIVKVSAKLTSETNLEISRGFSGSLAPIKAMCTIIEYAEVKSLQYGSVAINNTAVVNISSVDLTKAILTFNFKSSAGISSGHLLLGKFNNPTQISFENNITNILIGYTVNWYVVEFK